MAIREDALPDEYDYESDSDLDEFEETKEMPTPGGSSLPVTPDRKGKHKAETPDTSAGANKEHRADGQSLQHRILLPSVAYRT